MGSNCLFYVCGYFSGSGYWRSWESDGKMETVEWPFRGVPSPNNMESITVQPGQHVLKNMNDLVDGEEMWTIELITVPVDEAGFAEFCKEAAVAGQAVYDRLLGYKNGPRFGKGPFDYNDGFDGAWLKKFVTKTWTWVNEGSVMPRNVEEALGLTQ